MTYAVVAFMRTETRLHPGNRYTTLVDATRGVASPNVVYL